ncbi:MAG: hypothetical protein WKG07_45805 [Hymenobacter sp.]
MTPIRPVTRPHQRALARPAGAQQAGHPRAERASQLREGHLLAEPDRGVLDLDGGPAHERRVVLGSCLHRGDGRGRPLAWRSASAGCRSVGARVPSAHPAFVGGATVEVEDASVWFGQKVALSELGCSFGPGVTGLLGPNGAGKSSADAARSPA